MHASPLRRGLAGAALALGLAFSATACSTQAEVARPYDPSQGVNVEQSTMKLRNIALVHSPEQTYLSGGMNSSVDDELTGVQIVQLNADGSDGPQLPVQGSALKTPGQQLVQLTQSGISVGGDAKAGQTARITFAFAKAGSIQVTAPVLTSTMADYKTVTPKPGPSSASASGSAAPSSAAPSATSATPSATASS